MDDANDSDGDMNLELQEVTKEESLAKSEALMKSYDEDALNAEDDDFDKWSKDKISIMYNKFFIFVFEKDYDLLRWISGQQKKRFDRKLKEQEYWNLRFDKEYNRLKDKIPVHGDWLVVNIDAYIFHVTGTKMLGSDKYPIIDIR